MSAHRVRRPTEDAAVGAVSRSARPLPQMPQLFAGLMAARAVGDRYGVRLFACAVARAAEGGPR